MSSETKFFKVKIEGIFNLEEFSNEYEMTPNDVIKFHNQHCGLQEILSLYLSKYVQYVYLPSVNYEKQNNKLLKNTMLGPPTENSEKKYGVLIILSKNLQIHYKIRVKRSSTSVELLKENTFVNNRKIEQTIEQLFEKASSTLYPLHISVEKNGELGKILNADEIAERWKDETYPKLKEY